MGIDMKMGNRKVLIKMLLFTAAYLMSCTAHAAEKEVKENDFGQIKDVKMTENMANKEAGVNPGEDFSWEIFLPAFVIKPLPPKWGADSWVCCSISPYTFSLAADDVTKKATRSTCGDVASWEGWVETTAGPKEFTWATSGGCNSFTGSFTETLENGKNYLFKAEWTGTTVTVSMSLVDGNERAGSIARDVSDSPKTGVIKVFSYSTLKTTVGRDQDPACR